MEIIIAIVVGLVIWFLIKKKQDNNDGLKKTNSVNSYSYEIVGEQSYQQNLKKIAGPKKEQSKYFECMANVISEPTNKYDQNAIKVQINGLLVGYLSKKEAQRLSGKKINKTLPAVINGGWNDGNSEGSYGVKLAIQSINDLL